jgi:protocatechuate 3,4-dioxygenase beta subunit
MIFAGFLMNLCLVTAGQVGMPPRQGDSATGLIVGQVVDADSGRPISGAIVTMSGPVARTGEPHPRILTGSDGRFVYRGLRRGSYNISASKPGFVPGAVGRTRPAGPSAPLQLADGERNGEATIRLWKQASIAGTVIDEAGERLIAVHIQAYRRAVVMGKRRYVPAGSALTDDRGVYRISGLTPGDYIVGAVARQTTIPLSMNDIRFANPASITTLPVIPPTGPVMPVRDVGLVLGSGSPTPPPAENGRIAVYPPTFHPNAATGDAASVITLRAGAEHVSADLQLRPVPSVAVSGYVAGPEGAVTGTRLRLVAANTIDIALENDSMSTLTDRAGRFTFPAVPSGHYNLRMARQAGPGQWGEPNTAIWTDLPVSVGNEDIENLVVEAQPGVRIGGRIEFEGGSSTPFSSVSVIVESADPLSAVMSALVVRTKANNAGEFESPALAGGRYYVRVQDSPSGWMFKSATANGRDVADTPLNVVTDTLNVVVTFTDRWSGLRGVVQSRQGPDANAAVLIFPTDTETWGSAGISPRRVRSIRTSRSGEYSANLPAGEYYVIAVPDAQSADWQDPEFIDAAGRAAARVTIVEGERRSLDLKTQGIR